MHGLVTAAPVRIGFPFPVVLSLSARHLDRTSKRENDRYEIAAITNDIDTREDAELLTRAGSLEPERIPTRAGSLEPERIPGVETGGCPHIADFIVDPGGLDRSSSKAS